MPGALPNSMVILKFRITSFLVARDPTATCRLQFLKLNEQSRGVGCIATGTFQSGNGFALASNDLFAPCDMTADHGQMVQDHVPVHVLHDSRG
jgi:hypothetical protein